MRNVLWPKLVERGLRGSCPTKRRAMHNRSGSEGLFAGVVLEQTFDISGTFGSRQLYPYVMSTNKTPTEVP